MRNIFDEGIATLFGSRPPRNARFFYYSGGNEMRNDAPNCEQYTQQDTGTTAPAINNEDLKTCADCINKKNCGKEI